MTIRGFWALSLGTMLLGGCGGLLETTIPAPQAYLLRPAGWRKVESLPSFGEALCPWPGRSTVTTRYFFANAATCEVHDDGKVRGETMVFWAIQHGLVQSTEPISNRRPKGC